MKQQAGILFRCLPAVLAFICINSLYSKVGAAPYVEMVPRFTRLKSNVTIRSIEIPTRANLDFAASDRNPVLADPAPRKTGKRRKALSADELTFGGIVGSPAFSLDATPLTKEELLQPLAWKLMLRSLWGVVKDGSLEGCGNRIASKKWTEDAAYQPYQEVVAAYLHKVDERWEFWLKIECAPWSSLFKNVSDEDGDGVREFYGKMTCDISSDSLKKIVTWIREDYCSRKLSRTEAYDWVVDLASYWYPTRNTDILDLGPDGVWPDKSVRKKVRKETGSVVAENPLAVIEGKPFSPDKPIYNVYIVPSLAVEETGDVETGTASPQTVVQNYSDNVRSLNFNENSARWYNEVKKFGPYPIWIEKNRSFFKSVDDWVSAFPAEQTSLPGTDGWIFFRKSFNAMSGGDLTLQVDTLSPVVHIAAFNNYLKSRGIDMLFVVVPDKVELYNRHAGDKQITPSVPIVKPYGRKLLGVLQQQGVEVIDLLPCFLEAASRDSASDEPVYQKQDTHWTSRGLQIAAQKIADRISRYSWRKNMKDTVLYRFVDTMISRQGDLVERLPPDEQANYKPVSIAARRVILPDGTPYKASQPQAPILLIGDSFTGVFELIDCKSAGVGAHIAARTMVPVDIITSWGGGPLVRRKMLRARRKVLDKKRVVVYMMVARDLYHYKMGWDPLTVPGS